MQARVLGAVDVVDDEGEVVPLRGPMPTRLLAILVAARPQRVSIEELIARLWEDVDLPEDPVASLRTYVARVRSVLGAESIVTGSGTYALGDVEIDADRFEELVTRARQASGSPAVVDLWSQALELWRGPAFGELSALDALAAESARLDELRAEATEAWIDARLASGEGREVVADVNAAVAEYPFREGFRAQQMTVLGRAGRQAEALRAFQQFRADMTEIGLEPSQRLVEIEQQIAAGVAPNAGARRTLRGYELGDRLGEGAFAIVHLATQSSVGRDVAVKQIRGSLADQPEFIRQFEAEAHLVARLEHPNIVPLYDYWREPGSAYLVMRYLEGGTLERRIMAEPVPLEQLLSQVDQVAAALDEAHRAGVIHRDVKPANILLDRSGNAYLSDFGIAVEEAERVDPEAWLSNGSPAYAPPEQLRREPVGPRADIFALGVTVYEALTGRLPFPGETTMAGLLARQLNEPIPLVRTTHPDYPAAIDTVLQKATAKDPADRYQTAGAFALELAAAAGLEGVVRPIEPEDRNPYKGLSAFDEADASDFAGRDRLVSQLIDAAAAHRALVVVGPSGSGKSSAVRAGLLPAIRQGRIPGSERWFVTTMIPGADPFADLESALLRVAVDPPADLHRLLSADPKGLAKAVDRIVPDNRELVLVIDQFEELFTLTAGSDRQRFLDAIVEAATFERTRLRIIATLRADFYDHPLRHPAFAQLIREATVPVHPLAADELERAITEPARAVGATFEPGLVAAITADVADQPGALPLLQYALTELFDQRVEHQLTRQAYTELGGVAGALARRAEDIYNRATIDQQQAARRIFGRLVNLGEGTEDTRRRVRRAELGDRDSVDALLTSFGHARLLAFDRDAATREPTVEVAHEALLREWPRLRTWLDEDRDGLRILRHLTEASSGWDDRGREESELYRGGRLEAAADWAAEHEAELNPAESDFIVASLARRDAEEEAERRAARRLRRLLAGVGVVAVVAIVAGAFAFQQQGAANRNAAAAETERIAAEAATLSGLDLPLSLLLAVEAYERDSGPVGLGALQETLTNAGTFLGLISLDGVRDVRWLSNDRIAAGGPAGVWIVERDGSVTPLQAAAVHERSRDIGDGNVYFRSVFDAAATSVAFARADDPQVVEVIDTSTRETQEIRHGGAVDAIALSSDGSLLLSLDLDGWLTATDLDNGTQRWRVSAHPEITEADLTYPEGTVEPFYGAPKVGRETTSLSRDPQIVRLHEPGSTVVTVEGPMLRRWDLETGDQVGDDQLVRFDGPPGLTGPVAAGGGADLVLDADGERFVAVNALVIANGRIGADPAGQLQSIDTSTAFYALPKADQVWWDGGSTASVLFSDGRLGEVDHATGELVDVLATGLTGVTNLDVSPDGSVVAFASNEGIGLWSRVGDGLIASGIPREGSNIGHLLGDDIITANYSQIVASGWKPGIWWDDSGPAPVRIETPTDDLGPDWGVGFRWDGQTFGSMHFATFSSSIWDLASRRREVILDMPGSWNSQAASPDGSLGAFGTFAAGGLTVYSIPDGARVATLSEPGDGASSMAFSAGGAVLASVGADRVLRLHSTETWELLSVPALESVTARAVDFSADGRFLVTLIDNGDLVLRNTEDYEIVKTLVGPGRDTVTTSDSFFFDETGRYLITSSGRLWDLEEGVQVGVAFPNAPDFRTGGKDGFELLTAVDEHILRWNLDFESWPEIACQAAGRNMTLDEWEQFGPAGEPYRVTCPQWPAGT